MAYEMIIDVGSDGERIALLKDKKLVELHQEKNESGNFLVGEIYLGKVKKIMPGLNAAFVDIGHEIVFAFHFCYVLRNFCLLPHPCSDGFTEQCYFMC